MRQMRLVSTIEAKCRTLDPPVKFRGGVCRVGIAANHLRDRGTEAVPRERQPTSAQ